MRFIDETERSDKRMSAIHEAGHAVVAFTKGVFGNAWLERSETSDPMDENTWVGQTRIIRGGFDPIIGIAGVVAECLDQDPEVSAEEIVQYWQDDIIDPSSTDLQLMPDNWEERLEAVEVALDIVSKKRALFDSVVSKLVECNLVTAYQMAILASSHSNL